MQGVERLIAIMAQLRDPRAGCPWDLEQDFTSIAPYTIEEAYEVVDAIDTQDFTALQEELGDLLLQVVFHARMAQEQSLFDFTDVVETINAKLVRRHPHVFGDAKMDSAAQQTLAWEALKAQERRAKQSEAQSLLDGIAKGLPALMRAEKLQRRAASVGFDWPEVAGVWQKLDEELSELRAAIQADNPANIAEELGDVLFTVVNLARHLQVDSEQALRHCADKFTRRFRQLELVLRVADQDIEQCGPQQLELAWEQVKRQERQDD